MAGELWLPRSDWARSAADSAYPELWDGLFTAWVPSVGFEGARKNLFDAGPYHLSWGKVAGGADCELHPRIGLTLKSGSILNWTTGVKVPLPLPELTVVSVFKPCSGYGGSNTYLRLASCTYSSNGWQTCWYHPSSGTFSTQFNLTTASDGWNSSPVTISGIQGGKWYVAVFRYNGKVKSIELYDEKGNVSSASATLATGGPINYYWYSQNYCYLFDSYDTTDRHGGCLIYSKDIGPGFSRVFGKGGPFAANILKPFLPRSGKVFAVGYQGASYEASATSQLNLTSEANLANLSRGVSATSALELISLAAVTNCSFSVGASNNLTLSSAAGARAVRPIEATSAVALADLADLVPYAVIEVAAESTLSLLCSATGRHAHFRPTAESTLELTQSAAWMPFTVTEVAGESILALTDEAAGRHAHFRPGAASALDLAQTTGASRTIAVAGQSVLQSTTVEYDPTRDESVTTIIGLQDTAELARQRVSGTRHSIPLRQTASVVRVKAAAIDLAAESVLELSDSGRKSEVGDATDHLVLSQLAAVDRCKPLGSELELTDLAGVGVIRNRGAGSAITLHQSVAFSLVRSDVLWQYRPFVGEGAADAPSPPPATLTGPMEGVTAPFQLVYPAVGDVTDSVTLRAPNLGNKDRLSFNRILRETRGGTLIVYADPIWPKIQTLVLSFSGLRRSEARDLLEFCDAYLGQEIGLIDWEQRYWKGIIVSPNEPVVEDSFNSYSASFEFEGELDSTWSPQVVPWLPGTPLRRVRRSRDYGAVNPLEPEPQVEVLESSYSAEADVAILVGQPVYVKATGHVALAVANNAGTASAVGFAVTAAEPTFTVNFLTEGKLTLVDWTAVAGTASLAPGNAYYLDAATAGKITNVVPASGYVVRLGRATSAVTLDIEIEPSVRL